MGESHVKDHKAAEALYSPSTACVTRYSLRFYTNGSDKKPISNKNLIGTPPEEYNKV